MTAKWDAWGLRLDLHGDGRTVRGYVPVFGSTITAATSVGPTGGHRRYAPGHGVANLPRPHCGGSPKVNCATCLPGVYRPLLGVDMAKDFAKLTVAQMANARRVSI